MIFGVSLKVLVLFIVSILVTSFVLRFTLKLVEKRKMKQITGSKTKLITVYEDWNDVKLQINMSEFTYDLIKSFEWCFVGYQYWVQGLLLDASKNPLLMDEVHWFGEDMHQLNKRDLEALMKAKGIISAKG